MRPLFTWYHLQSDELLASWLFFLACLPFIPYVLIFLVQAPTHQMAFVYVFGLLCVLVAVLGTLLFVYACYPSENKGVSSIQFTIVLFIGRNVL
jgi:hypothetical protein